MLFSGGSKWRVPIVYKRLHLRYTIQPASRPFVRTVELASECLHFLKPTMIQALAHIELMRPLLTLIYNLLFDVNLSECVRWFLCHWVSVDFILFFFYLCAMKLVASQCKCKYNKLLAVCWLVIIIITNTRMRYCNMPEYELWAHWWNYENVNWFNPKWSFHFIRFGWIKISARITVPRDSCICLKVACLGFNICSMLDSRKNWFDFCTFRFSFSLIFGSVCVCVPVYDSCGCCAEVVAFDFEWSSVFTCVFKDKPICMAPLVCRTISGIGLFIVKKT